MSKAEDKLLAEYNKKRNFKKTAEPSGKAGKAGKLPIFVVQKHAATRLHWDFRLELDGVLKSWAVTNEPVPDWQVKRLAVRVEDHPLGYATFAGDIPKGQYGGGHVEIWDSGTWEPHPDEEPHAGLERGKIGFTLHGTRMQGGWALVRLKHDRSGKPSKRENWLLFKEKYDGKGKLADKAVPKPAAKPKGGLAWVKAVTAGGEKKMATVSYQPELATRVDVPPAGDDWLHELKFDGYRALLHLDKKGAVQIVTRNGLDWTHRFPKLVTALQKLKASTAALDGEIVVMDKKGRTDFSLLQMALGGETAADFTFMAFDLLELDGQNLKDRPLIERKAALETLIKPLAKAGTIRFSDHVIGNGAKFLKEVTKLKAEGIISKRSDSYYSGKRGGDWLKIKVGQRQEFVIGGFTRRSDDKTRIGSLLIGTFAKGKLTYAGRVGTGFAGPLSDDLLQRAAKHFAKTSPFTAGATPDKSGVQWLAPVLVGEVEFAELTREGVVRHAAFKGLRGDKAASAVSLETVQPVKTGSKKPAAGALVLHGVTITHPERVVYPEDGITKGEVAQYYADHAELILQDLAKRPLSVMRCPDGSGSAGKVCFFQRHLDKGASVQQLAITDSKSGEAYFAIATPHDLLSLVQLNVLEFHPWNTDRKPYDRPDRLIFDLDPDPAVGWPSVVAAAETVRDFLSDTLGLDSLVKTTGGKGVHIVVPVQRAPDWAATKAICRAIAETLSALYPDAFTSNPLKAKRKNKIYLDYLRNDNTATAVGSYILRARAGAPVSTPVTWAELKKLKQPDSFTLRTIDKRLGKGYQDPWAAIGTIKQTIGAKTLKALAKA